MQDKSIVDDQVMSALQKAGKESQEALRIKREMDLFYQDNREWLQEEKKQINDRDEVLTEMDPKVQAKIAAARKRFEEFKKQLQNEVFKLIRQRQLAVQQRENGWMVFGK